MANFAIDWANLPSADNDDPGDTDVSATRLIASAVSANGCPLVVRCPVVTVKRTRRSGAPVDAQPVEQ